MSCPAPEQLAAAATEGDDAILAHAAHCAACTTAIADQRDLRALARRRPAVVLTQDRREAMAAEVMALADRMGAVEPAPALGRRAGTDPLPVLTRERREAMAAELLAQVDEAQADEAPLPITSRRLPIVLLAAGLAAAAAVVILLATRGGPGPRDGDVATTGGKGEAAHAAADRVMADRAAVDRAATEDRVAADRAAANLAAGSASERSGSASERDATAPRARPSVKLEGAGDYAREVADARATREVVRLRGGELTVDSTSSRPVEVVNGTTSIAANKARFKVIATKGVVSSVAVFAGSAEVTIDGHRVIVEAGTVWERDVARDDALAAFRTGWTALRAGDNAAAIEAFDRATDITVAEDAAYWSAIASERAGDTAGATRRYRDLLSRFPATTRATEARAAIERLTP